MGGRTARWPSPSSNRPWRTSAAGRSPCRRVRGGCGEWDRARPARHGRRRGLRRASRPTHGRLRGTWWKAGILRTTRRPQSGTQYSLRFHGFIVVAQDVECGLAFSAVTEQSLAVVEVLDARQGPARRAEIHQHPGDGSIEERNPPEHGHLAAVHVGLILLSEARQIVTVAAGLRIGAEFPKDERLIRGSLPGDGIDLLGESILPADVFIAGDDVERL